MYLLLICRHKFFHHKQTLCYCNWVKERSPRDTFYPEDVGFVENHMTFYFLPNVNVLFYFLNILSMHLKYCLHCSLHIPVFNPTSAGSLCFSHWGHISLPCLFSFVIVISSTPPSTEIWLIHQQLHHSRHWLTLLLKSFPLNDWVFIGSVWCGAHLGSTVVMRSWLPRPRHAHNKVCHGPLAFVLSLFSCVF